MENAVLHQNTDNLKNLRETYAAYRELREQRRVELGQLEGILQHLEAALTASGIQPSEVMPNEIRAAAKRKSWTTEQKEQQKKVMREKWAERRAREAAAAKHSLKPPRARAL